LCGIAHWRHQGAGEKEKQQFADTHDRLLTLSARRASFSRHPLDNRLLEAENGANWSDWQDRALSNSAKRRSCSHADFSAVDFKNRMTLTALPITSAGRFSPLGMNNHPLVAARRTHSSETVKVGSGPQRGSNLRRMGMIAQAQFIDDAKVTNPCRMD
jgi:hypothetical protein